MICDYRLKVFHTVALKGSFTAAAKELGITQPAVSNHIAELEGAIGDLLFNRNRKETVLTNKGRILFGYAEKILHLYRCVDKELVPSKADQSMDIRIVALPEAARYILKPLVEYFTRINPNSSISVQERSKEEAMTMLADGDADIAIIDTPWQRFDTNVFATVNVEGAAYPLVTYYMSRNQDNSKSEIINDFILCCKTYR